MQGASDLHVTASDTGLEDHRSGDHSHWWSNLFGQHEDASADHDETADDDHDSKSTKSVTSLGDKFKNLGTSISRKFHEMNDGSHRFSDLMRLHKEVDHDLKDEDYFPELLKDAHLRRDNNLSPEEIRFSSERKRVIAESGSLKRFLGLDEDVHPEDVPVIAFGGSGGGYRACLGFLAAIEGLQESGVWELTSYSAGVSGSTWTLGALYTFAAMNAAYLLDHFATGSKHHPLSFAAINAVARSSRGVYFQLAPIIRKLKVGHVHPTPLDLYGTLVTSHIFLSRIVMGGSAPLPAPSETPEEAARYAQKPTLRREWFQWSRVAERMQIDQGLQPLPIITAVRHERPWKDWKSPTEAFGDTDQTSKEHQEAHSWWQWYETSPYEFGCDELEGWIPTWAFGRTFDKGVSTQRLPETSLSLLLGIATSAPAGPLAAWLGTIYRNLPKGLLGDKIRHSADKWVEENPEKAERLQSHHPVHAVNEPNPFFGAEKEEGRGQGFENSPRIHLVDAGMSNNLPIHVFFRPHRHVDIMLLGDYSSDVQSGAALSRIQNFGKEKGLNVTPRTPLPDLPVLPLEGEGKDARPRQLSADEIEKRFEGRYAQVLDAAPVPREEVEGAKVIDGILYNHRHQPQATHRKTLVYLPLIPNKCQPDYDPSTAPFSSSYNLKWTTEQVQTIRKTSKVNTLESIDVLRSVILEAYERKKAARLAGEDAGQGDAA